MFKYLNIKGIATLPTVLLLGGVIIEIAVTMAFLSYYFITITHGSRLGAEAIEVARAGADEAVLRVVRNKNYSANSPFNFTVSTNPLRVAIVQVCRDDILCDGVSDPGKTEILSTATVVNRKARIRILLTVDPSTGLVSVDLVEEKTL